MVLSQTICCAHKFGDLKAIEMLANAGYDAIDYNLANIVGKKAFHTSEEYRKYTARLLEKSKENGVYFNQGHAVTYVPSDNPENKAKLLCEANKKAIEFSSLLGIKTLVVHPVESGTMTLKDAVNECMGEWAKSAEDTFYVLGSVMMIGAAILLVTKKKMANEQ